MGQSYLFVVYPANEWHSGVYTDVCIGHYLGSLSSPDMFNES